MKVYFLCSKSLWHEHCSRMGETHGVELGGGMFAFAASTHNLDPGTKDHFNTLPGTVALPDTVDPSPISKDALAALVKAGFKDATAKDTMYTLARKLMKLSPVFDPNHE